jgi:four helix bundle protein
MANAASPIVNQQAEDLKERTLRFAERVVRFCRTLPKNWEGRHVADQLFRSGTGIAANYHSACRARSPRDFISKLGIVIEETDESRFWLVFTKRVDLHGGPESTELLTEAEQLLAIFIASAKTASANLAKHH